MVIVLDLTTLRKRILPQLATRYFGGLEGSITTWRLSQPELNLS